MNELAGKGRLRVWLLLIVIGAAILRLLRLGNQSLWTDELLSYWAFTSMPDAPYWKKFLYDVHAPLYHLVLHFWSKVSLNDFWLRLPSAIAGVAAVALFFRWVREFLDERTSLLAAVFLAFNPLHLYYSQEVRFYSFLVLFTIVALIRFERFINEPGLKNTVALAVALAAMCMSHFSGLFIVLSLLIVTSVRAGREPGRLVRFLAAVAILLVIISPWIYREAVFLKGVSDAIGFSVPQVERFREERSFTLWAYPYSMYAFSTGYSFGPDLRELHLLDAGQIIRRYLAEFILFSIGFMPVFLYGLVRMRRRGRLLVFLSVLLVSLGILSILALSNVKVFNVRYLLSVLPFYIALIAAGIPEKPVLRLFFAGLIISVMLFSDYNYHFKERYARDDVKGAVSIVSEFGKDGDVVLALTVSDVFRFYYRGTVPVVGVYPKTEGPVAVRERVKSLKREYRRVWYIRCRNWDWDPGDTLLGTLKCEYRVKNSWFLPGVDLYLFESLN